MSATQIATLESLLASSKATTDFRAAVGRLSRNEKPGELIQFSGSVPPVKGLRAITKLLEQEPDLEIRDVQIEGKSGCSDFVGKLRVNSGEKNIQFKWDCAWRAKQEGLVDALGYPDQIVAAQTFGYQCFEEWTTL